jgi:hypothetical protein
MSQDGAAFAPEDWLSGESGQVWGVRATSRALRDDAFADAWRLARLEPRRLARAAAHSPSRRVLALGLERTDVPNVIAQARDEFARSHHEVVFATREVGEMGKFQNLNALLAEHPPAGFDWLLIVDDDVTLPAHFLDGFLFLAERFGFALAQPAHRARSHAAWRITRRRPGVVAHETSFVEIGPLCALSAATFDALLPFPPLRFGWGLDAHWSAVARAHDWRMGVVDATAVRHGLRRIASSYSRDAAVAEARVFLGDRPYTTAAVSQRMITAHRSWR